MTERQDARPVGVGCDMLKECVTETICETFRADIFIAGSKSAAVDLCREFCLIGLCVSVTEAEYVYTGGMESGVRIGLINYPRFPSCSESILETARRLAKYLIWGMHQSSCTIVSDKVTIFMSRRP
jgi:hypothetical protein